MLDLKPLTVFCGANSSGKSSLLQSILLLAQTMRRREKESSIDLNGDYTSLGTFDDVKTTGSEREIGIQFTYKPESYHIVDKTEYPFNHVKWPEKEENSRKRFSIDSISNKFFFSQNDKDEKTKIRPEISRTVFSVVFIRQNKNEKEQTDTNNTEEKYILTWDISKSKNREYYDIKEIIEYPDKKTVTIRNNEPNFPFESGDYPEFQERLAEQFIPERTNIYCSLNHFLPEAIGREINNTYGCFLELAEDILNKIGCRADFLLKIQSGIIDECDKFFDYNDYKGIISEALHEYIENHFLSTAEFVDYHGSYTAEDEFSPFVKMSEYFTKSVPDNSSKWFLNYPFLDRIDMELEIKKDEYYPGSKYFKEKYGIEEEDDDYADDLYDRIKGSLEDQKRKIEANANDEKHIIAILDLFLDFYKSLVDLQIDRLKNFGEQVAASRNELQKLGNFDKLSPDTQRSLNDKIPGCVAKQFLSGTSRIELDETSRFINNHLSTIFDSFFKDIYYLGPLREDPKPLYPFPNNDNSFDLGRKGEHTASVLFLNGEKTIKNIPLPNREETQNNGGGTVTIKEAVKQWLTYIGVAGDIEAKLTESGIALKIQTPGSSKWSDLTNVGVGVSQVIPIVVMCLTAPKGATLILEQPELHLHPAMQTKLVDFFVSCILCKKQLIIETHSEYIINRLRLRIVNSLEPLNNLVKLYFVENLKEDINEYKKGGSYFRSIEIDEYASMSDWPEGFFDESSKLADEIIKATSSKWQNNQSES
jgi:predicted ATPase